MLAAVRNGVLGGIFQEDQKVPALRARALNLGWWQLVETFRTSPARAAVCVTRPAGQLPLLAFRKSLAKDRARLATELQAAFAVCGLPAQPAPVPRGTPCTRPPSSAVTLCVEPGSLDFHFKVRERRLTIRPCSGKGPLNWRLRANVPWLSFSATSGTATDRPSLVTLTADTTLPNGFYPGQLTVTVVETGETKLVPIVLILGD